VPPVVIDNPILNSPFDEPERHFRFSDDGITDKIADGRRRAATSCRLRPRARSRGR
jgi:type III restriction enzyme